MQEIDTQKSFDSWLRKPKPPKAAIQDLDLNNYGKEMLEKGFEGSIFLGCELEPEIAAHIVKTGGVVIPDLGNYIFKTHRAKLYSPEELFAGFSLSGSYQDSFDYKVYEDYVASGKGNPKSIQISLARRLHDHSITDALHEEIEGRKVVAIMGGHNLERKEGNYLAIAKIARKLTRDGYLIVSGGGPGAMEAGHLGAYFAGKSMADLQKAMRILKPRPKGAPKGKEYLDEDWLHRAWRVKMEFPLSGEEKLKSLSIAIPTWLYGHEPPTVFAPKIAKYFANSVREDGLVSIAKHGIIFAPGSAGTVQEIFQDNTQNYYGSLSHYSPMILFGREYWTEHYPAWQLLEKMSKGRRYAELLYLSDDEREIIDYIKAYRPEKHKTA